MATAVPRHGAEGVKEPATEEVAATLETDGPDEAGTEGAPVNNKATALIVENCTECNKELPGEFFACKSCPGELVTSCTIYPLTKIISAESGEPILILCDECAFKPELNNVGSLHSFADHFLVLVRNRNTSYIHGEPEPESKNKAEDEEPTIKSLQAQMSKMLELIEKLAARVAPELLGNDLAAT